MALRLPLHSCKRPFTAASTLATCRPRYGSFLWTPWDSVQRKIDEVYREALAHHELLPPSVAARGFDIFKSPVRRGGLFICGINPGRGEGKKHSKALRPPEKNELLADTRPRPYARNLRSWFEKLGRMRTLEQSNITNLIFWGSNNWEEWRSRKFWDQDVDCRDRTETFCFEAMGQLIPLLRPRALVLCGMKAAAFFQTRRIVGHLEWEQGPCLPRVKLAPRLRLDIARALSSPSPYLSSQCIIRAGLGEHQKKRRCW
eukprot:TRINITY_DN26398_c0_g1_i1.p1 TRINITY_DN26398_c0_g1~~TRINITY_DN26398_c0_g1_i1.p1  ORF type:complete len:258 (-),score=8.30 TRINITY_DN26398_c0_g1_i1:202-975(-)